LRLVNSDVREKTLIIVMVELHRIPSLFEITGFPLSGNDVNKQFWFFF